MLSGCASAPDEPIGPGTRIINLVNPKTGEKAYGAYAHDEHYDAAVMAKITHLFRDQETGEEKAIDPHLIDVMEELLSALALPQDTQISLTSGYRSPAHQAALAQRDENAARKSLHTTGQAADIHIAGVKGKAIGAVAQTLQKGGVCYYPKTGHIHVDTGRIRTWEAK